MERNPEEHEFEVAMEQMSQLLVEAGVVKVPQLGPLVMGLIILPPENEQRSLIEETLGQMPTEIDFEALGTLILSLGISEQPQALPAFLWMAAHCGHLAKGEQAKTHGTIANILIGMGRLDAALQAADTALRLQKEDGQVSKGEQAKTHGTIAIILRSMGRLDAALQAAQMCQRLEEEDGQVSKGEQAKTHHAIANILSSMGRLDAALHAAQMCQRLQEEDGQVSKGEQAKTHHAIANILDSMGRLDAALQAERTCQQLEEEDGQVSKGEQAKTHGTIAIILRNMGRLDAALQAAQTCQRLQEEDGQVSKGEQARTHQVIAVILRGIGRLDAALQAADTALRLLEEDGQVSKGEQAKTHGTIAIILRNMGRLDAALQAAQTCQRLQEEDGQVPLIDQVKTLFNVWRAISGTDSPLSVMNEARERLIRRYRLAIITSENESDRFGVADAVGSLIEETAIASAQAQDFPQAYANLEEFRGLILRLGTMAYREGDAVRAAQAALAEANQNLVRFNVALMPGNSYSQIECEMLDAERSKIVASLPTLRGAILDAAGAADTLLHDEETSLPPFGTLHLAWLVSAKQTWLFAADSDGVHGFECSLDSLPIGKTPVRSDESPFALVRDGWARLLPELGTHRSWTENEEVARAVFPTEVRALIEQADNVLITPHDRLWDVVIEDLAVDGVTVLAGKTVQIVESMGTWRQTTTINDSGSDIHSMGINDHDETRPADPDELRRKGNACLLAAVPESVRVGKLYNIRALVDNEVTPGAFLRAFAGSRLVHFASHARLVPGNPLSCTFIVGKGTGSKNVEVSTRDLIANKVNCRIFVMSCCDTGGRASHEGLVGHQYVLRANGIRVVVATRWSVNDAACFFLMQKFHELLLSGSVAESLAQMRAWARALEAVELELLVAKSDLSIQNRQVPALLELIRNEAYAFVSFGDPRTTLV